MAASGSGVASSFQPTAPGVMPCWAFCFAISKIDEEEAHRVFRYLKEMGELEGVDEVEASTGEAEAGR